MKKVRVFQLARQLKISSEALMNIIEGLSLDAEVKSHMSSVNEDVVGRIKEHIAHERAAVREAEERKSRFRDQIAKKATTPAPAPVAQAPSPPAPPIEAPAVESVPAVRAPAPITEEPPVTPRAPTPKVPTKVPVKVPAKVPAKAPAKAPPAPKPAPASVRRPPTTAPPRAPRATRRGPSTPARTAAPTAPPTPRTPRPAHPGVRATKARAKAKKKRGAVDQKMVRESVRKTLASMDTGRKRGRKRRREDAPEVVQGDVRKIQIEEFATVAELAGAMDAKPAEVIAACLQLGIIANINRRLDRDSIEAIADEFEFQVEFTDQMKGEEVIEEEEADAPWEPRAPIVTVMGHVDHGKTSLLDSIRKTNVISQESGAITQHIGAYEVRAGQGRIVFLDTPGHEAFTAMRARGVQVTDCVILVVAADDRVNEQTVEAINHAKAANVPIIVAINKCDLPGANPDKIKKELSENNLLVEEWGGKTVAVEISAKTGDNVDKMLEMVLLVAEMLELKAQPERPAKGVIVEAKREKGRGIVGTVLVETGTMKVGDYFVCGSQWGRVRALMNDHGENIAKAGPATPVEVLGWSGLPMAGDLFRVTKTDDEAREISTRRSQIRREYELRQRRPTLDSLQEKIRQGEMADLRVILKTDVTGSVEVLSDTLEQQSTEKVALRIVHAGVGNITESDVNLALASEAIILGFHVRVEGKARASAEELKVDIRLYEVIHEVLSDIRDAMAGKLKPKEVEKILGEAEVRQIFRISRLGNIAGSFVTSGVMRRQARARVLRDSEPIFKGRITTLRRFKDDVKEVSSGFECGITIDGFDEFKENDRIQAFEVEEVAAEL